MAKQTQKPPSNGTKKPKGQGKKPVKDAEKTPKKRQSIGDDWSFKEKVLEALKQSLGIISNACIKCNISRPTFYKWYKEDEKFREGVDDVTETQKDFVEGNLLKKIKDGDTSCIIFYCKTRLKDRGYAERYELTGRDGESIKTDNTVTVTTQFADVLRQMAGVDPEENEE